MEEEEKKPGAAEPDESSSSPQRMTDDDSTVETKTTVDNETSERVSSAEADSAGAETITLQDHDNLGENTHELGEDGAEEPNHDIDKDADESDLSPPGNDSPTESSATTETTATEEEANVSVNQKSEEKNEEHVNEPASEDNEAEGDKIATQLESISVEHDENEETPDVAIVSPESKQQKEQEPSEPSSAPQFRTTRNMSDPAQTAAADDDVTAKDLTMATSTALAAVAAAATAKNKSPAEAAREARAVAQSFINTAADSSSPVAKEKLQTVKLSLVKTYLRQRSLETGSAVTDKLCQGENDAFLQHLLLLEHFRCANENDEESPQDKNADVDMDEENKRAAEACEKLEAILKRIEGAYDGLVDLLPTDERKPLENLEDTEDYETPVVVPDLLPPCTSQNGDATAGFFRACVGESYTPEEDRKSAEKLRTGSPDSLGSGQLKEFSEQPPPSKASSASPARSGSVFSSMFKRNSSGSTGFAGVFRKKSLRGSGGSKSDESSVRSIESTDTAGTPLTARPGEYVVKIEREMLGLTVENVLERTVVRTVLAGGPAKKAGAKVGSLIVKVGNVETKNLTHFETIDELRQSQRPLQLVLRQVSDEALRSAREEMGRLIRGSGFGAIMDGNRSPENPDEVEGENKAVRPLIGADLRIDAYTNLLRRRFAEAAPQARNKKEEALARVGEKLAWILTLFVIGLERESSHLFSLATAGGDPTVSPKANKHSLYHHTAKDYADAAKSVSKVLLDYTKKKLDPQVSSTQNAGPVGLAQQGPRRGLKGPVPPPQMTGRGGRGARRQFAVPGVRQKNESSMIHEKPLLQVGDVLQRTRTFLADTTSPPAALLRGELIAFLCDVLDIDTDMELAEEENVSATGGHGARAGGINDLGSAGSLLKLIVLNCPIIRSPGCEDASSRQESTYPELEEELRRRFGHREKFSTVDLHRLHAGNRFLAVVHRLAASRSTSARITACSLGPVVWGHLDFPHQLQLRGVITRALHDVDVLVRKATATVLHEIAELVFDPRSVPWLVLMCERAMTDPEPQLRSAAMTLTWHLAENLPNAFLGDASQGSRYLRRLPSRTDPIFADVYLLQCKLLPVATRLAEDRSPSVRLAVAAQCDRLCDALGDHWSSVVIDVLLALLSDSDERVRCEAVSCVPRLAEIVLLSTSPGETAASEVSILEALIPACMKLQKDPSASVRVALAAAAGELLTLFVALQSRASELASPPSQGDLSVSERSVELEGGKKYKRHVDERLIPLVQTLLNDADPEVTSGALRAVTNATRSSVQRSRTRLISIASEDDSASLSSYHSHASPEKPVFLPVLSEVQVLRLLPTLTELADSRQWRVRQSAVEIVPALLGCTQMLETRTEISKLCVRLMGDRVDAVRKTAAECLCMGGSSLGSHGEDASAEWIGSIVIPTIRKCAIHNDSKQRLLSLKMVEVILGNGVCPVRWKGNANGDERMTDTPMRELVVIALSLATDSIANVRLNVGRTLETVINVFEEEEVAFIQEVLTQQIEMEKEREGGGDRDVIFFAGRCVNRAKILLEDKDLA